MPKNYYLFPATSSLATATYTSTCLVLLSLALLASLTSLASASEAESKCSETELLSFSDEYEQCHAMSVEKLQLELTQQLQHHRRRQGPNHPIYDQSMICKALNSSIEDCTVILGWCYTATEVEVTKQKQKVLMQTALLKMFPEFNLQDCTTSENSEEQNPQLVEEEIGGMSWPLGVGISEVEEVFKAVEGSPSSQSSLAQPASEASPESSPDQAPSEASPESSPEEAEQPASAPPPVVAPRQGGAVDADGGDGGHAGRCGHSAALVMAMALLAGRFAASPLG